MTKAKISEYDPSAANNTDVNGVNIAEGCAPSGINNAIREVMAALKRFETGSDGDSVTVGGNLVVSGSTTIANTATLGNVDINGGSIDGAVIGAASAAAGTFTTATATTGNITTVNATTVDTTNIEVTNIKAKDGTASASIADSTGVFTHATATVFPAGTNTAPSITTAGDTNTGIYFPAADTIAFTEGGVEAMRINSSGNVGIGITNPLTTFVVSNGSSENMEFFVGNVSLNGGGFQYINRSTGTTRPDMNYFLAGGGGSHKFYTDDSERMRIDSSGNVGIGTSSPDARLSIVGGSISLASNAPANAIIRRSNASGSSGICIQGNTNDTISDTNPGASIVVGGGALTDGFEGNITLTAYGATGSADRGRIAFRTRSGVDTTTERMRIDSSGNLGLGVTPSAWSGTNAIQLWAGGNISSSNNDFYLNANSYYDGSASKRIASGYATSLAQEAGAFKFKTATTSSAGSTISWTEAMTLDASGNLGIGTTSPAARVHGTISASTNNNATVLQLTDNVYCDFKVLLDRQTTLGNSISRVNTAAGIMAFETDNTERARITSGGYFKASNTGSYDNSAGSYHEFITNQSNTEAVVIRSSASDGTQYGVFIGTANDQNDATRYFLSCKGSTTERATLRSNGGLANYSANNVNLASDERLKKDISPLATSWNKIKAIEVVNFRYKDCNEGDPLLYGVIAQQVQPIVPELVVVTQEAKEATEDTEATPEYYGIREQPMYWLAIKALQEAMTRIETLEAEVAALKAK